MKQLTSFVILMGAATLAACASQAPATSTGTGAGPESIPATASAVPGKDQIVTREGYRRVVINGQERFCQIEPVLGSHVEKVDVCLTAAQLQARAETSREFIEQLERWGALPSNSIALAVGGATGMEQPH